MKEEKEVNHCLNCNVSENEIPLVNLNFAGNKTFICSRCLPVLIHSPQKLIGKLDGAENIPSANH
ncbi:MULTISPECIES: hypothetical protein [Ignavibacterium]|jgi:hypothetical protein|uniref:hypothetical protein n=1 Tax=Ignavibacterium TaxID=795750 RepID=UPI0025BFD79D|nr:MULTISPECIES: hypothetical protein [Ignavibacterium]MBI5660745.1 hypothetical protein [Ignavibacterium album]